MIYNKRYPKCEREDPAETCLALGVSEDRAWPPCSAQGWPSSTLNPRPEAADGASFSKTPAAPGGPPRLVVVPDHLWDAFEGVLSDCGISLVNTDGGRSFRLGLGAPA